MTTTTATPDRMRAFYRRQSPITAPGRYAAYLQALPADPASLIEIVGGLCLHYNRDLPEGASLQPDRRAEVDSRFVERMLGRIIELDPRPLDQARPAERRLMGTCRDFNVLLCTMLRATGTPARVRYGFVPYRFNKSKPLSDHALVEYWSEQHQSWRYCDARLHTALRERYQISGVDPVNVSDIFVGAPAAWLASQRSRRAAVRFSGFALSAPYGIWRARNLLMYDLASLAGCEPLLWDVWGYILLSRPQARPSGFFQIRRLNRLARLDARDPREWAALMARVARCRFVRVPDEILACSQVNGDHTVALWPREQVGHAVH